MKSSVIEFIEMYFNEFKKGNLDGKSINDIILYQGCNEKMLQLKLLIKCLGNQTLETLIKLDKVDVLIEYLGILYEFVSKYKNERLLQQEIANRLNIQPLTLKKIEGLQVIASGLTLLQMQKFIQKK